MKSLNGMVRNQETKHKDNRLAMLVYMGLGIINVDILKKITVKEGQKYMK